MPSVNVRLSHDEVRALAARAAAERRSVRDQASWLLTRVLRRTTVTGSGTTPRKCAEEAHQEETC